MRRLLSWGVMFGLIFGIHAIAKAAYNVHPGKDPTYGSYYDVDFSKWVGTERERIRNAYRHHLMSDDEYHNLNDRLRNAESFHEQAVSKGWITPEDQRYLKKMESRLTVDIKRKIEGKAVG